MNTHGSLCSFTLVLNLLWPYNYLTVSETSISSATIYFQPAESVSVCLLFFPCPFCLQESRILLVPGEPAQVFVSANAKLSLPFPNWPPVHVACQHNHFLHLTNRIIKHGITIFVSFNRIDTLPFNDMSSNFRNLMPLHINVTLFCSNIPAKIKNRVTFFITWFSH